MSRGGSRLHQILWDRDGRTAETERLVARAVELMTGSLRQRYRPDCSPTKNVGARPIESGGTEPEPWGYSSRACPTNRAVPPAIPSLLAPFRSQLGIR